jgi:multicomponent Na+:H+ antiporter subunit F
VLEAVFIAFAVLLSLATFLCLFRAVLGPSAADRVVAINVIGTKAVVIICLISFAFHQEYFLDVAIVYALISFVATVGIAKYLEKGSLE